MSSEGPGQIPSDGGATKALEVAQPCGLGFGFLVGLVAGLDAEQG